MPQARTGGVARAWWSERFGESIARRKQRLQDADRWYKNEANEGFVLTRKALSAERHVPLRMAERLPEMAVFGPDPDAPPPDTTRKAFTPASADAGLPGVFPDGKPDQRHVDNPESLDMARWAGRDEATVRECVMWAAKHLDVDSAAADCDPPGPLAITWWRLARKNSATRMEFLNTIVAKMLPSGIELRREEALDIARDVADETVNRVIGVCELVGYPVVSPRSQGHGTEPGVA